MSHGNLKSLAFRHIVKLERLRVAHGHRFFKKNIGAGQKAILGHFIMHAGRNGDRNDIRLDFFEHIFIVQITLHRGFQLRQLASFYLGAGKKVVWSIRICIDQCTKVNTVIQLRNGFNMLDADTTTSDDRSFQFGLLRRSAHFSCLLS